VIEEKGRRMGNRRRAARRFFERNDADDATGSKIELATDEAFQRETYPCLPSCVMTAV